MSVNRRTVLHGSLAAALAAPAKAAPLSSSGLDAAHFGVRAGTLMLAPGIYHAGGLTLPPGASLAGMRGATKLMLTHGPSLVSAEHSDIISLTGLTLDGGGQPLPAGRALAHFDDVNTVRITDCEIAGAGGNGITLESCSGEVTHSTITSAADNAL